VWYFNPVTWQFLFILGGAAAVQAGQARAPDTRPLRRQPLFIAAAAYALLAGVITLSWRWPHLHDAWMPAIVSNMLYPISKTDLSPVRLVHFLALAYVTAKLLPGRAWTQNWLAQQSCRMGRYSLEVFCLGVLLAPLADMLNAQVEDAWPMRVFSALLGLLLMAALAAWLEFIKNLDASRHRPLATGK
jgi:hypothetical protein